MTLPGISDAERLESLRDGLAYARQEVERTGDKVAEMDEGLAILKAQWWLAKEKERKALTAYVSHLEAMAAGGGK